MAQGMGLLATMAAIMGWNRDISDKARRARERAGDAADKADTALEAVEEILASGPIVRGDHAGVADLEVGISFPQQGPSPTAGPYAQNPSPTVRPAFTEDDATDVDAYPGRVSNYTSNGNLKDVTEATGQNVSLGKALRLVEVRAFILGLVASTPNSLNPPKPTIAQYFRLAQGFARALAEQVTGTAPDGLSQDAYTDAARRFLAGIVSGCRKIAQLLTLNGVTAAGAGSETVVVTLTVPAGTFTKDGDRLVIDSGGIQTGQNAAELSTVSIRQGSASGTAIATTGATNAPAGRSHIERAILTRVGPNQVRASGFALFAGGSATPTDSLLTWDFSADVPIVFTVLHGSANTANITQIDSAAIFLQT